MKINFMHTTKFLFAILCCTSLSMLLSCENALDDTSVGKIGQTNNLLAKSPSISVWSGSQTFGSTRAEEEPEKDYSEDKVVKWERIEAKDINLEQEKVSIAENIKAHEDNTVLAKETDILYFAKDEDLTLDFYLVYHQTYTPNNLGVFYFDEEGEKHEITVWEDLDDLTKKREENGSNSDNDSEKNVDTETGTTQGIRITVKQGYKFGLFWGGDYYPVGNEEYENWHHTTYYSTTSLNPESYYFLSGYDDQPPYKRVNKDKTSQIHAITFVMDEKTYIGIEDWIDFDFEDWVFMCTTVIPTVDVEEKTPEFKEEEPSEDLEEDSKDELPDGISEVEVNLAINDYAPHYGEKLGELASKLSIHVRAATDVEIKIPMPAKYLCDNDDLIILQKHEGEFMVHGGPAKVEYEINGITVTLNYEYVSTEGGEDGYIRVWTDGINEELMAYLFEENGDGINFEIWAYFNLDENITVEELKKYIDQAIIEFLDEIPHYYINAFTDHGDGHGWEQDCTLSVVEEQRNEFFGPEEGNHLNASKYNKIYKNKKIKGKGVEHSHKFLW